MHDLPKWGVTSEVRRSKAYSLAVAQVPHLHGRYRVVRGRLESAGRATRLTTFEHLLLEGRAAINVSLSTCVKILEAGKFLTAFDIAEKQTGARNGPKFDKALRNHFGRFYSARLAIENHLLFDGSTKYAALHIGGPGPGYGPCCIILEARHRYSYATCFAGDSVTSVFDSTGVPVVPSKLIHERFSTRRCLGRLGVLYNEDVLAEGHAASPLDRLHVETILCEKNTLLEIHIHEPVVVENISRIAIDPRLCHSIHQLLPRYDAASPIEKMAMQFDNVVTYLNLHKLALKRRIDVSSGVS